MRYLASALCAAAVIAILIGLFSQLRVIPTTAVDEVDRFPPYEPFALPYVTVAILGVACVQVAVVAVWVLLGILRQDVLFSPKAFHWVDVIIGSTAVATLLTGGVTAHLAVTEIPSPADGMEVLGALGAAFVTTVGGAFFTMLLVLMRGLLSKATQLQTEMSEVV